jgi:hypothetical protein
MRRKRPLVDFAGSPRLGSLSEPRKQIAQLVSIATTPPDRWTKAFAAVAAQGQQFDEPLPAGEDEFWAFLSQADEIAPGIHDVVLELVPDKWMNNAIMAPTVSVAAPAPSAPAVWYHIPSVPTKTIVQVLGLASAEDLVEGSWFVVTLSKSAAPAALGESDAQAATGYVFATPVGTG